MEKIKDVTKSIIPEGTVLVEIIKPKRLVIVPDGSDEQDSYMKIVLVGGGVTDLSVGDIVVKCSSGIYVYPVNPGKSNEKMYATIFRSSVMVAVHPDNFIDPDNYVSKITV
jgi:hypothetical protein